MLTSPSSTFTLSNGIQIPCMGLGTWQVPNGGPTKEAVKAAIRAGYRHIDTASRYGNEEDVGAGVREACEELGLSRSDIFVSTKVWKSDDHHDPALAAFDVSLEKFGFDYIDLYLIHWAANEKTFGHEWADINASTWSAFEEIYESGRARAIGVSNFDVCQLEALVEGAKIVPMVNQIESHPGFWNPEIYDWCQVHNVQVEAWSPFGSGAVLGNEELGAVAAKYGVSTAQLCVRWNLQRGVIPFVKSVHEDRIIQNADVFGFEISPEDMEAISAMPYMGGMAFVPADANY